MYYYYYRRNIFPHHCVIKKYLYSLHNTTRPETVNRFGMDNTSELIENCNKDAFLQDWLAILKRLLKGFLVFSLNFPTTQYFMLAILRWMFPGIVPLLCVEAQSINFLTHLLFNVYSRFHPCCVVARKGCLLLVNQRTRKGSNMGHLF